MEKQKHVSGLMLNPFPSHYLLSESSLWNEVPALIANYQDKYQPRVFNHSL